MSVSSPFINRPIATSLLGFATVLGGALGYFSLPVSSLPQVDFPTVQVTTQLPGANPQTMSTLVTASLERELGQIPALATMTSTSSYGLSQITLQFNLGRDIDAAAQDVQSAINAAGSTLPRDLPYPPTYAKVNPADAPIVTLALTSDTVSMRELSDLADTLIAQRLSTVTGVGHVSVEGGIRPAVRIEADISRLAAYGMSMSDLSTAIVGANVAGPKGSLDGTHQSYTIAANDQIETAAAYREIVVAYRNSAPVRLKDVATVSEGLENARVGGWLNGTPAVIIDVQRQPGANVIETVDRLKAELPRIERALPTAAKLTLVHDRTGTIRASIHDVQFTLLLSVALVVMVVLIFLRSGRATMIAGVALPVSLIATFGVMWFCGFSIDNLSLMALTIGTGFVVDDAIVMIENIVRHIEKGARPLQAALDGAKRDRLHGHLADAVADRRVHPASVHDRDRRAHVQRVRSDADHRRRRLGRGLADAHADDVRAPVEEGAGGKEGLRLARVQPGHRRRRRGLPAEPRMGAAPPAGHAPRHGPDARRHHLALCHCAQGLSPRPGHGPHHRDARGGAGRLLRRADARPGERRRHREEGPSGRRRRRRHRRRHAQHDAQRRATQDHAEAARGARAAGRGIVDRLTRAVAVIPGVTVYFQPVQDVQIATRTSRAQYQYTLVSTSVDEVAAVVAAARRGAQAPPRS